MLTRDSPSSIAAQTSQAVDFSNARPVLGVLHFAGFLTCGISKHIPVNQTPSEGSGSSPLGSDYGALLLGSPRLLAEPSKGLYLESLPRVY
jgi:hypothetical protein